MIFSNRYDAIAPLLERCFGLGKEKKPGEPLRTTTDAMPETNNEAARLLEIVRGGSPLSLRKMHRLLSG